MTGNLVRRLLWLILRPSGDKRVAQEDAAPVSPRAGLKQQSAWLQSAIRDVTEITASVGTNVGQHTDRIAAVSRELEDVLRKEPSVVVALATRMLAANEELQSRLNHAEQLLQDYSRQLSDALTSARTDALTGLLNRRALDDELQRCIAEFENQGRPAALLLLDVDNFKQFNDRFGHQAGDEVLKRVTEMLRGQARDTDILARYGGEEFIVVLTSTTAAAVRQRAEQMRAAVGHKQFILDGQATCVTASAGLAELTAGDGLTGWLRKADEALYAAKRQGRNCGYWKGATGLQKLTPDASIAEPNPASRSTPIESEPQVNDVIAVELLNDDPFLRRLNDQIDQWKRGGPTLTVLLARLTSSTPGSVPGEAVDDFIAAARELTPAETHITRWRSDGVALLMPDTDHKAARRFVRQLCEAFGGLPDASSWFQAGMAEGLEGNTPQRILERAALALAACSAPFEVRLHDGIKAVPVATSAAVRRLRSSVHGSAPAVAEAAVD
jgi:diguanylate cyclase